MGSKPKPSSRSLKSFLREIESDGVRGSAYAAILRERLNGEDLRRMQMEEARDLARRRQEHQPADVRDG
jgi:hypothetical protein